MTQEQLAVHIKYWKRMTLSQKGFEETFPSNQRLTLKQMHEHIFCAAHGTPIPQTVKAPTLEEFCESYGFTYSYLPQVNHHLFTTKAE